MINRKTDLELNQLYRKLLTLYREPEAYTAALHDLHLNSDDSDQIMLQIADHMEKISSLDARIRPLRETWNQTDTKPSPALRATLEQLERSLVQVMRHIEKAEADVTNAKQLLEPRVTNEVKRQRMANAYGAALIQ